MSVTGFLRSVGERKYGSSVQGRQTLLVREEMEDLLNIRKKLQNKSTVGKKLRKNLRYRLSRVSRKVTRRYQDARVEIMF